MNIYKISQEVNNEYDTYDSAIVVAKNEEQAKTISPNSCYVMRDDHLWYCKSHDGESQERHGYWAEYDDIKVELIGIANDNIKSGLILASFNAG